ncbi:MAG: MotA/TolQ/ExbB proton channel family protein [Planctomycetota bacterium]
MARPWILPLLVGVALAAAQESPPDLAAQVERLERELREETAALAELDARREAELERRRGDRAALAAQVFDARVDLEGVSERLAARRTDLATALASAESDERAAADLAAAGAAAAERLAVVLGEVPGQGARVAALLESASLLGSSAASTVPTIPGASAPSEAESVALDAVAEQTRSILTEARTITARRLEIHTASGALEPVALLGVGLCQFAYVAEDGARVGVALASPPDASGYRWTESIDGGTARLLREAVRAVDSERTGHALVPIDPTGTLRADTSDPTRSWRERVEAGGPVMVPLALVAALVLLLVLERIVVLFGGNWHRNAVAARVVATCRGERAGPIAYGPFQGGTVGRVLAACVDRRSLGQRAMEDGIQEQLLHESPGLQRSMNGLAVLAAVAPLLGLLGTVAGIIETFSVLQAFGGGRPSLMAGGVSEALVTTATGLVIAVPTLLARSLLRGRAERILADAERHAATLLMVLVHDDPHR